MTVIRHVVLPIAWLTLLTTPAAAQTPSWVTELERRVERRLEAAAGMLESLEALRVLQQGRLSRPSPVVTEPVTHTLRLARDGSLELTNVSGAVTIAGSEGDDVRIHGTKWVRHADPSQARAFLKEMRVLIAERGGTIEVRTQTPQMRRGSGGVDYTVSLPSRAHVTIRTVYGDVRVTDLQGEVRAEAMSGNVIASSVQRVRALKTIAGDITLTDAQGRELTASTVSGNVIVANLRVPTMEIESVSGHVRVTSIESERVRLRSISGDINSRLRLVRGGRYEVHSNSGNIRIIPDSSQGFEVEAQTFSGLVRSEVALRLPPDGAGRGPARTLRGMVGDAGAILWLRSLSGNIDIGRQ